MRGIAVSRLTKSFRSVCALRDVDLTVDAGEIVALLGPNGAGKSTLIRVLGTTVLPDSGLAAVAGYDVVAEPASARRSLGLMLGDGRSWYWRLTGRQNLEFFAALQGMSRQQARPRAHELVRAVGLAAAADRRVGEYSTGMRVRLSFARSLLVDPPVLLLDEPTQNLDPAGSVEFRDTLRRLAGEQGRAILLATHNLHEVAEVATRVVGLVGGRLAFARTGGAPPSELEEALLAAMP